MMDKKVVDGIKFVLSNVAGLGITLLCSAFAGNIVASTAGGAVKKACMALGGAVIGGMVAKQAENYISETLDEGIEIANSLMTLANTVSDTTGGESK